MSPFIVVLSKKSNLFLLSKTEQSFARQKTIESVYRRSGTAQSAVGKH